MEPESIQIQHFRMNGAPRVTMAIISVGDKTGVGLAICSMRDQPCKKTGRAIAVERAGFALRHGMAALPVKRSEAKSIISTLNLFLKMGLRFPLFKSLFVLNESEIDRIRTLIETERSWRRNEKARKKIA